ncbi:MFS transporter [Bernardetia sp.]|uniref:MFS transporter n=1 Tax=Bernardetia sp. TaxID=1937974 RepID=UPI0025C490C9|nr:MFS transporter [Bernardetia sp.]
MKQNSAMPKNNPRIINAWATYDWANSVYNLVITTTIFPIFFNQATRAAFGSEKVEFFGLTIENTVLYSYAIALSYLIIAAISPPLSAMADYGGTKKRFMQFFTYLGASACLCLFFFDGTNVELAIICAGVASIGYAGGMIFYNAFLPEIATENKFDAVSAKGFAMGYIGSVLLQILNILMTHDKLYMYFGFESTAEGARWSFLSVGIWWIVFAQIPFYYLKDNPNKSKEKINWLKKGFDELKMVWNEAQKLPSLMKFLISFFFFNMGVQTVMFMASLFGEKELKLETASLIAIILIIQVVAILGAYLFAKISDKKGNIFSLSILIGLWILICGLAYFVQTAEHFYGLAILVGLVMGGIQSLSRSTYSKLLPKDTPDTASYFSFFNVADRLSTSIGMGVFALIEDYSSSMRNGIFALTIFFIIGLIVLLKINRKAIKIDN